MVEVDDNIVPLPYQKVFRGKEKESISVIKAGNSVSGVDLPSVFNKLIREN